MSQKKTSTTAQKAAAAGAKVPEGHKAPTASKVKALQAEASEGDVIVEFRGETFTLHSKDFQDRMTRDYDFMEMVTMGIIPVTVNELLGPEDRARLKDLLRDPDTNLVSPEVLMNAVNELMEAGGMGN